MYTYIFLYLFSFIICIMDITINKRNGIKKFTIILFVVILTTISGTRYHLGGSDYEVYNRVYDSIPKLGEFLVNFFYIDDIYTTYGHEKGYLLLISIFKTLGFNFYGFTLINSIIFYSIFFTSIYKYTKNMGILFIIFLSKLFLYNTFVSMRQSLTIALFVYMWRYIEEENFKKYMFWCAICILLHRASFILIPVYFINKINLTRRSIIIFTVIFIPTTIFSIFNINPLKVFYPIINYIQDPIFLSKVENILSGSSSNSISIIYTLEYIILVLLVIRNYDFILENNVHAKLIMKIFLLLMPIFTMFRSIEIFTRLKDYFIITYGILLGDILSIKKSKDTVKLLILIYYCLVIFIRFIFLFDNGELLYYDSYLFKGINIFE